MLERERHGLILKLVGERSIVSVAELVQLLDVSEATIRRDIATLAEQGAVNRIRGGVEALNPRHQAHLVGTPFALSQGISVSQKQAIAQLAATLIEDGDHIIINGGTTTYGLVEFLAHRDLDIFTNSFPIAARLVEISRNRISMPGGTIFREQNIVLNPGEQDSSGSFWGNKMFTGCYGINRFGIMEADPLLVQAESRLLARADQLVVMADSRKLRQRSSMVVAGLERVSVLVTDEGARDEELQIFRDMGIKVMVAPVGRRAEGMDVAIFP